MSPGRKAAENLSGGFFFFFHFFFLSFFPYLFDLALDASFKEWNERFEDGEHLLLSLWKFWMEEKREMRTKTTNPTNEPSWSFFKIALASSSLSFSSWRKSNLFGEKKL
jgi:hypothetical protein